MSNRKYELLVLLDPQKVEEKLKETMAKIEELIAKHGGSLDKRDEWGKRRLTYEVNKRREGIYVLFVFDCPPTGNLLDELQHFCKIDEVVMRSMVTRAVIGKSLGTPLPPEHDRFRDRAPRRDPRSEAPAPAPAPAAAE